MSNVREVIEILKNAPRIGAERDVPEGVRYVQISETLMAVLIAKLEIGLAELEAEAFCAHAEGLYAVNPDGRCAGCGLRRRDGGIGGLTK